jgi:hypothetical protein
MFCTYKNLKWILGWLYRKKKPEKNQARPEKTELISLNRFFPKITEPNRNWFRFDFEFFLKKPILVIFFIKTKPNKK